MSYTIEFKNIIIKNYMNGKSVSELSKYYNVPRSSIYNWIDKHTDKSLKEFSISKCKISEYQRTIDKLDKENKIQQYVISTLDITKRNKIDLVYLLDEKQFPIKAICRILNINPAAFYHDKNRKPETYRVDEEDHHYKPLIQSIFKDSGGRFGGRKIRVLLKKGDYIISHARVVRLMKEMNLIPNQPDENYNNYHKRKYAYKPNIMSKSEYYPEVNKIWVSDITYIRVRKEHYYLIVIIDLYSRKVIGHKLAKTLEASELIDLMKKTYRSRNKPKELIFHSDQGQQYTAILFKRLLTDNEITQSFSKKGCPYDNSVAESFFASLKKEEIYRHIYNSFEELEKAIDEYIIFFNTLRPHASLKYVTPNEFENTTN
ncbi:IS3 family transposase [Liberiplasma polymorphum]|uniref:IS3 family transposase n=1 Tax=Liberiplasma polymorphum TaxID=3374570 RepID=UPI003770E8A6